MYTKFTNSAQLCQKKKAGKERELLFTTNRKITQQKPNPNLTNTRELDDKDSSYMFNVVKNLNKTNTK